MLTADMVADLANVPQPVLQIVGNKDPVHSVKGARWLTETLSNAKLVSLDGCGHYPMFGALDAFEAALLEFSAAEERSLSVLRYRLRLEDATSSHWASRRAPENAGRFRRALVDGGVGADLLFDDATPFEGAQQ
ncbi:alpha/beta hydrolase (plasmid) [Rhodococcus sp. ZPP]|uniref:alpha/beta fold hydrolase n=1 Tax=Rhodococcus sp. ZPP TaxID=2749906 RepID=UPI001AD85AA9|nr:alpha/beta hydrolase [Rhodococcus sp. ZPP]QTJ70688.1 alpha/beta hydrolase [Rhodococcus sp. ZPP]